MKMAKIIDIQIFAEKNLEINLNREVFYPNLFFKFGGYKFLCKRNLKLELKQNKSNKELQDWFLAFNLFLKAKKENKTKKGKL